MSGLELPRLYDPAWVHVKKLTTELSECIYGSDLSPTPTLVTVTLSFGGIFDSRWFSCMNSTGAQRLFANQCITAHKLLYCV